MTYTNLPVYPSVIVLYCIVFVTIIYNKLTPTSTPVMQNAEQEIKFQVSPRLLREWILHMYPSCIQM